MPPPAALKQLEARLHLAGHGGVHSHHLASYFSSLAARAGEAAKHGARDVVRVEKALVAAALRLERRAATSLGEDARAAAHRADDAATAAAALLGARWPAPRWPALVFLAGAMTCLGTSAACHLFGCCAQHVAAAVWRADYAGIVVLIVASFVPPVGVLPPPPQSSRFFSSYFSGFFSPSFEGRKLFKSSLPPNSHLFFLLLLSHPLSRSSTASSATLSSATSTSGRPSRSERRRPA